MAKKAPPEKQIGSDVPSTQDIIAVASGIASEGTVRRLWASSLSDHSVRNRVAWSLPPDDEEERIADAISDAPENIPEQLQQRARSLTERFVRVQRAPFSTRILDVIETLLQLPCLSPAIAATDSSQVGLLTQSVFTTEGVRIDFQQLPLASTGGDVRPTVRVLVDASAVVGLAPESAAEVTLSDADGPQDPLVIPLNPQARGYRDIHGLAPTRSAYRLVGASLSTK